jgi:polysaccharide deacetylase 2 family uncharacterized protein YibQ
VRAAPWILTVGAAVILRSAAHAAPVAPMNVSDPARPKLAIIIDDLGYSRTPHAKLSTIPGLTWSVFPSMPATKFFGEQGKASGRCVMVHLPMQNHAYTPNQVQKFLLITMREPEALALLRKHLDSLPQAEGVNNHSGDLGTENERLVRIVIHELSLRGLFFVDSVTSPRSVCKKVAAEEHVAFARRDVFLDDPHEAKGKPRESYVAGQLWKAVAVARKRGSAVAIGHPHPSTLAALAREVRKLEDAGVDLVPASALVAVEPP